MESIVGIAWAFSNKRQQTYATITPDGDLNQSAPFEGADIGSRTPNMSDNAALLGKGHEFATRNEILSWDVRFRRSFHATTKTLGWAFAFHLGKVNTQNLGGSPAAYRHVMEYQDPNGTGYYGSGRQQPVTTIVEQITSGLTRKFPSCQVMAVEVTGQLNDFVRLAVEIIGSGKEVDVVPSGFTMPDMTNDAFGGELASGLMRFSSLTFSTGVSGVETDSSCDARSFRFRSEVALDEAGGYCPGSGYQTTGDPASGAIRNKCEMTRRACLFEFVIRATNDNTWLNRLASSTEVTALLTLEGAVISGGNKHKVQINIPRSKYRMVAVGADGDTITYSVQTVIFYDQNLQNPFEVYITNTTAAYLASS